MKYERQRHILDAVRRDGSVTTNELIEHFGLAPDTIRKDLQALTAKGLVRRVRGGAVRIDEDIVDFEERTTQNASAKRALAQRAVGLVQEASIIYIDGGTTNLAFAQALPDDASCIAVTNAPTIALALCAKSGVSASLIGGQLNRTSKVIMGADAIHQVQRMNFEYCVLGVSHLSAKRGITYPSLDEAALKSEVMERSKRVIAIATREKLDAIAAFYAKDISAIDVLVTDETSEEVLTPFADAGVQIISQVVTNEPSE